MGVLHPNPYGYPPQEIDGPIPHCGCEICNALEAQLEFEAYNDSETRDTGVPQTDLYFGKKGTKGGHIAVDANGVLQHVRDADGKTIYDRKNGIGSPPPGWE